MREGWKEVELEELGTIGRGKSRHRPRNADFLYGNEYPFVQTADVKAAEYKITSYSQMYSEAGLTQSKLWPINTLCITIAANIADSSILGIEACFPDSVLGFISDPLKSDVKFVKYLFDMLQIRIKQISQGAAQDNLSLEKIRTLRFTVPNVETQRKIATILSGYDDLIENNLKRIKILEEMAQQTYEEWFVRMRFPGYETAVMNEETGLPEGWGKKTLIDLGKISTGKTPSTLNEDFYNGNIPFIKTPDMNGSTYVIETNQYLTKLGSDNQKGKLIEKNSLVVSCIGSAGAFALVSKPSQFNQQINAITFKREEYIFFTYCYSKSLKEKLEALGSNGATMTNVNKTKFEKIEIVLPDSQLLNKFHKIFKLNFENILNLQSQNQRLREARDLLLPRLMMGIVEV